MKLQSHDKHPSQVSKQVLPEKHILCPSALSDSHRSFSKPRTCPKETGQHPNAPAASPIHDTAGAEAETWFASHDTWGILDTGATKTVMGSHHVSSFLKNLDPEVRQQVQRTSCEITFRFGNQGTLKAAHAIVVPLAGMKLKIAVVEGATPFLVSNTLLRALGAMIDTSQNQLLLPRHQTKVPLKLSAKGLYLVDTNELFKVAPMPGEPIEAAETFAQDDHATVKIPEDREQPSVGDEKEIRMKASGEGHENQSNMSHRIHVQSKGKLAKQHQNQMPLKHTTIHKVREFRPSSNCQRKVPICESLHHGRLAATSEPCSVSDASSRGRDCGPPEPGAIEDHADVIRQGPRGQELRDHLVRTSGLDMWFFNHYKSSSKVEHKKMVRFIQLRIEEEENQTIPVSTTLKATAKPKGMPKSHMAKAKCQSTPTTPWQMAEVSDTEELMIEPPWIPTEMTEVQEEVQVIHHRLQGLENAMQQVISLISQQTRPSSATPSGAFPDTAVIEQHDPWDQ
jgi:hypothetical protein